MAINLRSLFALTALLALSANACSATQARSARTSSQQRECPGGIIANANDAARFVGCTAVVGDLRVERSQLSDLGSLESLRSVSGTLTVAQNSVLTDLTGLENLSSVGTLELLENPRLSSLAALSGLRSATAVDLQSNPELTNLRGLEGLRTLSRLALVNDGLFETSGLSNLGQAGELTIANNKRLINLSGLNGLKRASSVRIRNNHRLCARYGLLPRLSQVTETLDVTYNAGLSRRELNGLRQQLGASSLQNAFASR